uniref:GYF_2 domain-containing protein n=1 Tax=Steinernema glaseri TaxID=37863 RepID=A0A1I7YAW2_9BILA
ILKINSFLLYNFEMRRQNQSCDPIRVKRWVDAEKNYFIVYDCRQIDLKNMFGAMRSFDEPLYKQLTNAAEYARTYLARKEIDKKKRRYDQRENMKPKNNESDEELVVMEELNENNESDEELVVMEELDSDDELCYSIFL